MSRTMAKCMTSPWPSFYENWPCPNTLVHNIYAPSLTDKIAGWKEHLFRHKKNMSLYLNLQTFEKQMVINLHLQWRIEGGILQQFYIISILGGEIYAIDLLQSEGGN